MRILGIDPGLNGYLCLLHNTPQPDFWPTPTIQIGKGTSHKQDYDVAAMRRILMEACPDAVILEKQQAMRGTDDRKQGVSTTGKIMYGYGLWAGLIAGIGYRCQIVHPRTWQAKLHRDCPAGDTKARSIAVAGRLFPLVDLRATERCRKPHDGKADALLLAYYGSVYTNK